MKWAPTGELFATVYGHIPSKVTLYNQRCERLFDLGTVARNALRWDPFGQLLMVAGLGNIRGRIELWHLADARTQAGAHGGVGAGAAGAGESSPGHAARAKENARREPVLVALLDASDVTNVEFAPDGTHFLTATTTPRLRVNNQYYFLISLILIL